MKLSKMMAKKFEGKLDEYFEKEKVDPALFPQENYGSCFERAMDWIVKSFEDSKDSMATDAGYAIALNREEQHGDDTINEQSKLLNSGADPEIGTMTFWNQ